MPRPHATPDTSISTHDVYRILGARNTRCLDPLCASVDQTDPRNLMCCDDCPLRFIERGGLYAQVCSVDHQGLLLRQHCCHGFGPNLEGATKVLFDHRDAAHAARPSYRTHPQGRPYGGHTVTVEIDHTRDDLKDDLPDVDAWRTHTPRKLAEALDVPIEDVCRRLEITREEDERYAACIRALF